MYPDRWMVLKCNENLYKVFATWYPTCCCGESWKLNSGITKVEEDEKEYRFHGVSGSCYHCEKGSYGSVNFGLPLIESWNKDLEGLGHLEILEDCDWVDFFKDKDI